MIQYYRSKLYSCWATTNHDWFDCEMVYTRVEQAADAMDPRSADLQMGTVR